MLTSVKGASLTNKKTDHDQRLDQDCQINEPIQDRGDKIQGEAIDANVLAPELRRPKSIRVYSTHKELGEKEGDAP